MARRVRIYRSISPLRDVINCHPRVEVHVLAARGLGGEGGGGGGLFGGLMGGGGAPDETYVTVSWKGKEVGRTPVAKRGKGATDGGGEGGGEASRRGVASAA